MLRILFFVVASFSLFGTAAADEGNTKFYAGTPEHPLAARTALVIGVGQIENGSVFRSLKTPPADAARVTQALRDLGFHVINPAEAEEGKPDALTRQRIKLALYDFANILQAKGGVGLIYFAGHGIEKNGQMFLVPYDGKVLFERDLLEDLIPISIFYDAFTYASAPLGLIILDTCRDDPWTKPIPSFGNGQSTPSTDANQLARVIRFTSVFSGGKAFDGLENSPFNEALIDSINESNSTVSELFDNLVRKIIVTRESMPNLGVPESSNGGHEFVFFPTNDTYNIEKKVFETGQKHRDTLQQLMWQFGAGYFYEAAKDCLNHCDLVPASSVNALHPITLRAGAAIKTQPADLAPIMAIATKDITALSVKTLGDKSDPSISTSFSINPSIFGGDNGVVRIPNDWSFVLSGPGSKPGFVQFKEIIPNSYTIRSIKISFERSNQPGVEMVSEDSRRTIARVLAAPDSVPYGTLSLTGVTSATGSKPRGLQLLARQAAVLDEISRLGYNISLIPLVAEQSTDIDQANSVMLGVGFAGSTESWEALSSPVP